MIKICMNFECPNKECPHHDSKSRSAIGARHAFLEGKTEFCTKLKNERRNKIIISEPPVPTEDEEQEALFQWEEVSLCKYPELDTLFHITNEGKRSKYQGAKLNAEMTEIVKKYGLSDIGRAESLRRSIGIESNVVKGEHFIAVNNDCVLQTQLKSNHTVIHPFTQSKNKTARILSNSTWVMEHIYFPVNWNDRFPEYFEAMTKYQKEGKNAHDDAPDATTGIAEKITNGNAFSFE